MQEYFQATEILIIQKTNCQKGDKDADLVPWVCFYLWKPKVIVIGVHTAYFLPSRCSKYLKYRIL